MNPRTLLTISLPTLAVAALASCSQQPTACEDLRLGQPAAAVALVAPGANETLTQAATALAEDPERVFAALGLAGDEGGAGVVSLHTYDDTGNLRNHGAFNLAGAPENDTHARADAEAQGRCLTETAKNLPPAQSGGDAIRILDEALDAAGAGSTDGPGVAVVAGLGTSAIEDQAVGGLDLSESGRTAVLAEMASVSLVPDLSGSDAGLVFLDPSAGVESSISAAGVEAFAEDLCSETGATSCASRALITA